MRDHDQLSSRSQHCTSRASTGRIGIRHAQVQNTVGYTQLNANRFTFEPEITAKAARARWRIYEVPVSYAGRTYEEGKKIGLRDALTAVCAILYYRFFD